MLVVALTGGIGCGKSEAARAFAELGVPIVDLDVISHHLTAAQQPLVKEIARVFGEAYVTSDGALDRQAMRQLVFADESARQKLNALLHPAIFKEAVQQLASYSQVPYVVLVIPLLVEGGHFAPKIDRVLLIDCDEDTQVARVMQRSGLDEAIIRQIIATQTPQERLLMMADDVVENNTDVANLREKIHKIHQKYMNTCIVSKTSS